MTRAEFTSSGVLQGRLTDLLADPTLQMALTLLEEELAPEDSDTVAADPNLGSAKYQRLLGAQRITKGLAKLCKSPATKTPLVARRLEDPTPPTS
jgi:hypothetical protein